MRTAAVARPRVQGDREQEILRATIDVLADVGYDRLTMDAVAARAKASKATLYRRWNGKVSLVVEALAAIKGPSWIPDTGNLRGDLLATYCCPGGLSDPQATSTFASVVTALATDPEFAHAYRRDVLGPKSAVVLEIFRRARDRGELREDLDLGLVGPALAGIILHRLYVLGDRPTPSLITRIVDQIILPAALEPAPPAEGTRP